MAQNVIPEAAWPGIQTAINHARAQTPVNFAFLELTDGTKDAQGELIVTERLEDAKVIFHDDDEIWVQVTTNRRITRDQICNLGQIQKFTR